MRVRSPSTGAVMVSPSFTSIEAEIVCGGGTAGGDAAVKRPAYRDAAAASPAKRAATCFMTGISCRFCIRLY